MHGKRNDKISKNKDEALTSEDEQSDDGDTEADEPVANRQFHRRYKNKAVSSIRTFLEEVIYDMIDFHNVEVKGVDFPLKKKGLAVTKKAT